MEETNQTPEIRVSDISFLSPPTSAFKGPYEIYSPMMPCKNRRILAPIPQPEKLSLPNNKKWVNYTLMASALSFLAALIEPRFIYLFVVLVFLYVYRLMPIRTP